MDQGVLVIVEVKTRRGNPVVRPIESVTAAKRRQLRRLADLYLRRWSGPLPACRFDVVEILIRPWRRPEVRHHVDAFRED